jgi:hypothetical protein
MYAEYPIYVENFNSDGKLAIGETHSGLTLKNEQPTHRIHFLTTYHV